MIVGVSRKVQDAIGSIQNNYDGKLLYYMSFVLDLFLMFLQALLDRKRDIAKTEVRNCKVPILM